MNEHVMPPAELQRLRLALGLTQAELARLLPASRRTVEQWESKRGRPPALLERALRDLERERQP